MKKFTPVFIVLGIAIWSVWPMTRNPGRVADIGKDGELIIWIINQTVSKVLPQNYTGYLRLPMGIQRGLWDGNIYYPYRNVLAYSDMFIISGLTVWPAVLWAKNPAVANGAVMILGQVSIMLIVYGWWWELSGKKWGAMVAAIAFGLSQARWVYQVHMQMWTMQYFLLGIWLFWRWIKNGRNWQLWTAAIFLGLQAWESMLPVYFGGAVIMSMLVLFRPHPTLSLFQERVKKLFLFGIIAGIIALPPVMAYAGVSRDMGFVRSIRDAANNGLGPDYLWKWFGSPGLAILFVVAIIRICTTLRLPPNLGGGVRGGGISKEIRWLIAVVVLGVVMTMGPTLKWEGKTVKIVGKIPIPLPYAAAYYVIPGFSGFRTPSRWFWLTAWAGSGVIAIGLSRITLLRPPLMIRGGVLGGDIKRVIGFTGAVAVAILGGTRLLKYRDIPAPAQYPVVYKWLAAQPGKVVLQLPRGDENIETERMIYSLGHGKQLVNGFSGFAPPTAVGIKPDYIIVDKSETADYALKSKKLWEDERYTVFAGQ